MLNYIDNVRRNHALEHATVSLLLGRLGPQIRLVGRASNDGFFIYGDVPGDLLQECAHEGLARLKGGEGFWAVTPLCGTNIATAGILAGLSTMAVLGGNGRRRDKMGNAMVAGMLAVTVAQPLGRLIQRHVTTSPDLDGTEIVSIETRNNGRYHKVKTRRDAA
jgi:hypothetical protein